MMVMTTAMMMIVLMTMIEMMMRIVMMTMIEMMMRIVMMMMIVIMMVSRVEGQAWPSGDVWERMGWN